MATSISIEGWQTSCEDLGSRGLFLLRNAIWTDVEFNVGEEKEVVKAHRLVLASASPVFAAMLYGPLAEGNTPIRIPDVTPEIFNLMLEFIYTENVKSISLEKLPDFNYVSKKYLMPRLLETCVTDLVRQLDPENVVRYYELAAALEHQPLIDECKKVFTTQTKDVFATEAFLQARIETVEYIFSLDKLAIRTEFDLLPVIEEYAKANRIDYRINEKVKNDDKQHSIRPLLKKIRFLSYGSWNLADQHKQLRKLLSESEILSLMLNVNCDEVTALPEGFSTNRHSRDMEMPTLLPIPGQVEVGRVFRISGDVHSEADRFDINLQSELPEEEEIKIMLHISVRFEEDCCVRNSYIWDWGREEREGDMPFVPGEPFEVVIAIEKDKFKISVNGNFFCEYRHRISFKEIKQFEFNGEVTVKKITFR